jgi:hypothetical protein
VSDDYVVLTECLKQIEAERKRAERSN